MAQTEKANKVTPYNIYAIPDIHGRADLLYGLLTKLENSGMDLEQDILVFLGDYCDRGTMSKQVVDTIISLQHKYKNVIALKGNHEIFAIDAHLESLHGPVTDCWMRHNNGGLQTLSSFGGNIDDKTLEWMSNLPTSYEIEEEFFFSHAPVPKDNKRLVYLREQPFTVDELTRSYTNDEQGFSKIFENAVVGVCGHIHKLRKGCFWPRLFSHYLFCDAGAGCLPKAPLVAVECRTRHVIFQWPKAATADFIAQMEHTMENKYGVHP